MSAHPLNLALRFILELSALFALGFRGWTQHEGILRVVMAFAIPLAAAVLWGVFSTPGDRSRSATAVVPAIRLLLVRVPGQVDAELVFVVLGYIT